MFYSFSLNDKNGENSDDPFYVHGIISGHGMIIEGEYISIPKNIDIFVHTERNSAFNPRGTPLSSVENAILSHETHSKHRIKGGTIMEDMVISLLSIYGQDGEGVYDRIILGEPQNKNKMASFSYSGIILDKPTKNKRKPSFASFLNLKNIKNCMNLRNKNGETLKMIELDTHIFGLWDQKNNSTFIDIINTYPRIPIMNLLLLTIPQLHSIPTQLPESSIQKILNISLYHHNSDILSKDELLTGYDPELPGKFRLGYLLHKISEYIEQNSEAFDGYKVIIHLFVCRNYDGFQENNQRIKRTRSINQTYVNDYGSFFEKAEKILSYSSIPFSNGKTYSSIPKIQEVYQLCIHSYSQKHYLTSDEYHFIDKIIHAYHEALFIANDYIFHRNLRYFIWIYAKYPGKVGRILFDIHEYLVFEIDIYKPTPKEILQIIRFLIKKWAFYMAKRKQHWNEESVILYALFFYRKHYTDDLFRKVESSIHQTYESILKNSKFQIINHN